MVVGLGLRKYIIGRLIQLFPVIIAIVCVNFIIIALVPGDPIIAMIGEGQVVDPEWIELTRQKYGLDRPIYERLGVYLYRVFQGDLGRSFSWNRPVLGLILGRAGNTLLITITAQLISIPMGILLGAFAARNFRTKKDTLLTVAGLSVYSMPTFWMGLLLMYFFGVYLRVLPISGMVTVGGEGGVLDVLRHLIMPVIPITLWNMILYWRVCRASVIETLGEDFITTARAKGMRENRVFFRHALRNALLPVVTVMGINLGKVFTFTMVTETVFAWPGLGDLTVAAIDKRDYPTLMGVFFISSIAVMLFSLFADVLYAYLDPRIRYK